MVQFPDFLIYNPVRYTPIHTIRINPLLMEPIILVLWLLSSSEKLDSPIINPYTERRVANKPTPPTRNPKLSFRKYAKVTAVINNKKDAAARPADSFPFFASFFFVNEYLYLLAIMELSPKWTCLPTQDSSLAVARDFHPNMITDAKKNIPKDCPQGVQNHIIHIKTADLRDKLNHFHGQT